MLGRGKGGLLDAVVVPQGGGVSGDAEGTHLVSREDGVADHGPGSGHVRQRGPDQQPVVVGEQPEQVQRRQVDGAPAVLDRLPGRALAGVPEPSPEVGRRDDPGGPVQQHGGIGLAGETGEVGLPLAVLVDLPDKGLVGDRVRLGDLERGAERLVVIAGETLSRLPGRLVACSRRRVTVPVTSAGNGLPGSGLVKITSRARSPMVASRKSPSGCRSAMPIMVRASSGDRGTPR